MSYYLAKVVFKIVNEEPNAQIQFDEQLRLIDARNEQEAFFKARMLGVKNEEEICSENSRKIFWKFIDIPFVKALNEFVDGMEIYSCIKETETNEGYENYVKLRAQQIQNSFEKNGVIFSS
ncbi:MAG: DUF4288 domain-containing protein [Bacteroidota bacterium]|nr:DUF4288 domain-containing protein [Bacteroidota bacterium]